MFKKYLNRLDKETSVLNTDSFDKRRFKQIYEMSKGLQDLQTEEEVPMYKELLGDMWASLYKMKPQLKESEDMGEHLGVNKQLIERMMNEESYKEFHRTTQLDDTLSAIGTLKYGEQAHIWLQEQIDNDKDLQEQLENIKKLSQKNDKNNSKGEASDGEESKTEKALNQAMSEFSEGMSDALDENAQSFSNALQQASEETKETKENMESLFGGNKAGSGKGELQNMPLRDKIKLAEVISNDKKIKDIAKWAGRLTKIARTKQKLKHKESIEQSGIEQGNNIEKVLPSELVQYSNPATKNDFLKRYAEGQLLQYEQKGKESLGQGSIVLCLDQSGSMQGLEEQSKAFALALMSIAKKQKRNFAYIPFSSFVEKVSHFPKGRIKPVEMIAIAKDFLNGGTSFEKPLGAALNVIQKDSFKDADIIFVTDGEANISQTFLNRFHEQKEKNKFNVLSLVLGSGSDSTTRRISDKVVRINDFNDEGSFEAFEI